MSDDQLAFSRRLKDLIDVLYDGSLPQAAGALGVCTQTVKGWVKGRNAPGFKTQTEVLRKLRSLVAS